MMKIFESKKDRDELEKYLGERIFKKYLSIKDKIPKTKEYEKYRNFELLKKIDVDEIEQFIDDFQSTNNLRKESKKGAKKLYEDSDWIVYKITTYPAAKYYGKGTKWCISGKLEEQEKNGQYFFFKYIDVFNLDNSYYFYISKKDNDKKYCILQSEDGQIVSIWNQIDENIGTTQSEIPDKLPSVKEVNLKEKSLYSSIINDDLDSLKELLKNKETSIYELAGDTKKSVLTYSLKYSSEEDGLNLIKLFAENGKIDCSREKEFIHIINFILDYGNNLTQNEFNKLMKNLLFNSENTENIPNIIASKGNNILCEILERNYIPYNMIEWFLTIPNFDLNHQNKYGITATHLISKIKDINILNKFFEYDPKNININITDDWSNTPLDYALDENNEVMSQLLIQNGAKIGKDI